MINNPAGKRIEYTLKEFNPEDAHPDPIRQFELWFEEETNVNPDYSTAMILSTTGEDGRPSSRVVLLKGIDSGGFVFFTNYLSRKGKELTGNAFASLLFFWPELERQVRIEGKVDRISQFDSSRYFSTRPRENRISALISSQSERINSREELEEKFREFSIMYEDKEIPLPENWGGFCLMPSYFEFWQGRVNRLHDRIIYTLENGSWEIGRLAP